MPVTAVWAWHKKGHNELSESVTGQISKEQIYLFQYKSFNKKCSLKKSLRIIEKILKTILNLCMLKSKIDENSQKIVNVAFGTMVNYSFKLFTYSLCQYRPLVQ